MKAFGRVRGIARLGRSKIKSAARRLRNRSGQFAFVGGKRAKSYNVRRPLGMRLKGVGKKFKQTNAKADAWLAAHPNAANAIMVASLAGGGLAGLKIGESIKNAQNKKKK
jgi:hypothetical protein